MPSATSVPGFIDLQVNGFAGVDFNDPAASGDDLSRAIAAIVRTGVTRCLPTVITGSASRMADALANLHKARTTLPLGKVFTGFHVEGPHIAPEDGPRGAHPRDHVRPPDPREFHHWQQLTDGGIRLVTLSPHWPEAPAYIREVVRSGTAVSIGHTAASPDQIRAAVDAGATLSTHLGNAAPASPPKTANCIWDQLAEDRLSASFIADGHHLGDAFLRAAIRAKGLERTILVTDAAAPASAAPGPYRLGELDVELTPDHRVVLRNNPSRLAGSALRLNHAIAHVMRVLSLPLETVLPTVTTNPAKLIGLPERNDRLVLADSNPLNITEIVIDGHAV